MFSRRQTTSIVVIVTLTLMSTLVYTTPVDATAPSDIQLVYDFNAQTLTVNVSHYVANTKTHYIETIEIQMNGISTFNRSYTNQSYNYGLFDTFSVSASVGDNLTVTAFCKKGYSLTKWLIVTSGTSTNSQPTGTTTSTTEPTDTTNPSGATLGPNPLIAVGVAGAVAVFLIIFFAWLNPDKVPSMFRQISSRLRSGLSLLGGKLRSTFSWLKVSLGNLVQQIKAKSASR